jgi:GNAT superfamily N-acetyltransferase
VPGVYGVPEQWPHVRALYERAGFAHTGHTEVVYLAKVEDLPHPAEPPIAGLAIRRSVGINGTRLSAVLGEKAIGYIETETLQGAERLSRHGGWADIGNLHVTEQHRRRGVATWLLGRAADWLQLAQAERLLTYAWLERARSHRPGLHRLPGVPGSIRLRRTHPHQARMDPEPAELLMINASSRAHCSAFNGQRRLAQAGRPGHCLGICLPGSMNGFGTVMPRWRPVGVWTSNSWPSGSASSIGSIA